MRAGGVGDAEAGELHGRQGGGRRYAGWRSRGVGAAVGRASAIVTSSATTGAARAAPAEPRPALPQPSACRSRRGRGGPSPRARGRACACRIPRRCAARQCASHAAAAAISRLVGSGFLPSVKSLGARRPKRRAPAPAAPAVQRRAVAQARKGQGGDHPDRGVAPITKSRLRTAAVRCCSSGSRREGSAGFRVLRRGPRRLEPQRQQPVEWPSRIASHTGQSQSAARSRRCGEYSSQPRTPPRASSIPTRCRARG